MFPVESTALTRYVYVVEAGSAVSLNVVTSGVEICAKFTQPLPWQRSRMYPVTPTSSVEAVQDRLICVLLNAPATRFVGVVGGVVSGGAVAEAILEYRLEFPAESCAKTR